MNRDLSGATSPNLCSDESSNSGGEFRKIDAYWRACNYLSLGMLYLSGNPLLREPLEVKHIKERLIGHWGSDPGQSFIRVYLNRLIKKYDLNMIYVAGPGHGAPATLPNKEKGNINTPLGLVIKNQVDRFSLVMDVIDQIPRLQASGAHVKDWLRDQIVENLAYADEHGVDKPEIRDWKWTAA